MKTKPFRLFLLLCSFMSPIFVIGQTVIWQEDFSSYADGTTTASDNNPPSGVDWTRDISGSSNIPPGYFEVQSQAFSSFNTQGEVVWQTESITLDPAKRYYLNVDISYLLTSGNDYIRVYYQIDGGTEVLFGEFQAFSFLGGSQTFNVYALSGSSLSIRCEVFTQTDFFGLLTAVINFDNVTVTEHRQLYSISDGNWNSPGRWSVTRGGPSCACIPVPNDIVFITNSYTININNANMQVSGVRIENGGLQ